MGARVRAVVLAAGAGSRFGGRKLEARVAGRPILQHVLAALAAAGLDDPIVVLGPDSGLESLIAWGRAERVVNPDPAQGLASSLRRGWAAATAGTPTPDAVLVALGDQPRLVPEAVRTLVAAPLDPARPIVAPQYATSDARNPVRIEVSAAALIDQATGDRGLGPVLAAQPGMIRWLEVPGDNPDVDVRSDLLAAIEADWADRVRRSREQVERLRDPWEDTDHYAPVTELFRDDPRRRGDAVLDALLVHANEADSWLDVGAGAGRYGLPLALAVREVIAIEPSVAMVGALEDGKREHGIANVRVIGDRWPEAAANLAPVPFADVALIANVGHDTEAIGPFVAALDAAARRMGIAVMQERRPASRAAPFFLAVHGEAREPLPALADFIDLLTARGAHPEVELVERRTRPWRSRDEILAFLRRQTWVTPGSAADARLQQHLDRVGIPDEPSRIGVVRWTPTTA